MPQIRLPDALAAVPSFIEMQKTVEKLTKRVESLEREIIKIKAEKEGVNF